VKAYVDCVNANGGINGRPANYLVRDDQWNPETASQVAAQLVVDKKVVAMAGNSSFVEWAANASFYEKNGIISFSGRAFRASAKGGSFIRSPYRRAASSTEGCSGRAPWRS
jgi:ABC-type branched-subunit amino acid transport system substrate-binding protein